MSIIDDSEHISDFADLGIIAFTTTRQVGTFGMMGPEPVSEVMGRWAALRRELYEISPRLATGGQDALQLTGVSRAYGVQRLGERGRVERVLRHPGRGLRGGPVAHRDLCHPVPRSVVCVHGQASRTG